MKRMTSEKTEPQSDSQLTPMNRRNFLLFSGAAAITTAFAASCKKDDDDPTPTPNEVNLGSGDTGILNYAYALEQLEAAFYTQVVASSYYLNNASADEKQILIDLKNHEVAHREFFAAALGSGKIANLEVDFSSINFGDRSSVLNTAKAFEDLGVSAYNGAGNLLKSADYLVLAGQIVSVEARHAAAIRDLLNPLSADFAGDDIIDGNGLDLARKPDAVLGIASKYIKTKINASNLPK